MHALTKAKWLNLYKLQLRYGRVPTKWRHPKESSQLLVRPPRNFIAEHNWFWIGYLEEFPDYLTQGVTLEDLREHLRDLYKDLSSGEIPSVRRAAELEVA